MSATCTNCGQTLSADSLAKKCCTACGAALEDVTDVSSVGTALPPDVMSTGGATVEAPPDMTVLQAQEDAAIASDGTVIPEGQLSSGEDSWAPQDDEYVSPREAGLPEAQRSMGRMLEQTLLSDQEEDVPEATFVAVQPGSEARRTGPQSTPAVPRSSGSGTSSGSGSGTSKLVVQQRVTVSGAGGVETPDQPAEYRLLNRIGSGAMGEIWTARQTSMDRVIAVKKILKKRLDEASKSSNRNKQKALTQQFLAEAVINGRLDHPNIVPVHDLGMDQHGNLFLSMKLVSGRDWADILRERKLSLDENLEILRKISDAISFAHDRGIVHRDLKPSNIMVGDYGEVYVMDWGLALPLTPEARPPGPPVTMGRAGTPAYMAPELAEDGVDKIGPHTDVYLLGAMLFELVAGFPPHPIRNKDGSSLTTKDLIENARNNVIVHTDYQGELLEIALRAMQPLPRERYKSAREFGNALRDYQKHAESIGLANRAQRDLDQAEKTGDYKLYARALFGFEEALELWPANNQARKGETDARSSYAYAALKQQNYELGLSLIDQPDSPVYKKLYEKLQSGQKERLRRNALVSRLKIAAASLLAIIAVGGSVGGSIIYLQKADLDVKNQQLGESLAAETKAKEDLKRANNDLTVAKAEVEKKNDELTKTNLALDASRQEEANQRMLAETKRMEAELAKADADKKRMEAEIAQKKEEEAKKEALLAQKKAEEEEAKAKLAQKAAEEAKEQEAEQRMLADAARAAAEREWYSSQIRLVDNLIASNAFDAARDALQQIAARSERNDVLKALLGSDYERLAYQLQRRATTPGDPANPLTSLAVSPDKTLFATADQQNRVRVWSAKDVEDRAAEAQPVVEFNAGSPVAALAWSHDGRWIATGGQDAVVRVWNAENGQKLHELKGHSEGVLRLIALPNGGLASTGFDHTVRVWDVTGEKTAAVLMGHSGPVRALAVAEGKDDAVVLVSAGDDRRVLKWTLTAGGQLSDRSTVLEQHSNPLHAVAVALDAADEVTVFLGDDAGGVFAMRAEKPAKGQKADAAVRWTAVELARQATERHQRGVTALMLDPANPSLLASAATDNTVVVWNVDPDTLFATAVRSRQQNVLRGHGNAVIDVEFLPAGGNRRLVTASADGTARLWNPLEKAETQSAGSVSLTRPQDAYGEMLAVAFSKPEAGRVMGVGRDGVAVVWNSRTGERLARLFEGHHFVTDAVAFFPNDRLAATVSFDGTAALWNTGTGSMLQQMPNVGASGLLAVSPDGQWLITGSAGDGMDADAVAVWSVKELLSQPAAEAKPLVQSIGVKSRKAQDSGSAVAFSPDSRYAVVGTSNGHVQVFDTQARTWSTPVSAHPLQGPREANSQDPEGLTSVVFLNATRVATAGYDGKVQFWTLADGQLTNGSHDLALTTAEIDLSPILALSASSEGNRLAVLTRPGTRLNSDARRTAIREASPQVWVVDVSGDAPQVLWKLLPGGETQRNVLSAVLSSDGQRLLTTVSEQRSSGKAVQTVAEWGLGGEMPAGLQLLESREGFSFFQAGYVPQQPGRVYVLGGALVTVWERAEQPGQSPLLTATFGPVLAMQACDLSADGRYAVTAAGGFDPVKSGAAAAVGDIRLWDVERQQRVAAATVDRLVNSVALSPADPHLLAAGGLHRNAERAFAAQVFRWAAENAQATLVAEVGNHAAPLVRVRFSSDGRRLLTASQNGQVQVFDVAENGFELRAANQELSTLVSAALNADGSLAVLADSHSAYLLDVATGKLLAADAGAMRRLALTGHSRNLTDVRFETVAGANAAAATDQIKVWTTSLDGTAKLWSVTPVQPQSTDYTAKTLVTLRGHDRGVLGIDVSADGAVVTAGQDGRAIVWPLGPAVPAGNGQLDRNRLDARLADR